MNQGLVYLWSAPQPVHPVQKDHFQQRSNALEYSSFPRTFLRNPRSEIVGREPGFMTHHLWANTNDAAGFSVAIPGSDHNGSAAAGVLDAAMLNFDAML